MPRLLFARTSSLDLTAKWELNIKLHEQRHQLFIRVRLILQETCYHSVKSLVKVYNMICENLACVGSAVLGFSSQCPTIFVACDSSWFAFIHRFWPHCWRIHRLSRASLTPKSAFHFWQGAPRLRRSVSYWYSLTAHSCCWKRPMTRSSA
jgi:hypothetical protein